MKIVVALVGVLMLASALVLPAIAADLHEPHEGTSCPEGWIGTWHFVNNQTEGTTTPGTLMAFFDGGGAIVTGPSKINQNVQQFYVYGTGTTLDTATTNLPGKLVLSDFSCSGPPKKK